MNLHLIDHFKFITPVVIYLALSELIFFSTSGGWLSLLFLLFGSMFFVAVFIWFLLMRFFGKRFKDKLSRFSLKDWFIMTILFQSGTLLFNIGDCGDDPGKYFFVEKLTSQLFETHKICGHYPEKLFQILFPIFLFCIIGYAISLFVTVTVLGIQQSRKSDVR
ncbi:MAG: hypothetical protein Greene101449_937 [Candidatus Peregrinibacteria bacterium Greene1014_49]|nr:MAG: hypothetical protein Greene101449_937 [Candidatus Peregrinibacteria bacterium Greene1014_49]